MSKHSESPTMKERIKDIREKIFSSDLWRSVFRHGYRRRLENSDLIVWINTELTKPVRISISPTVY